MQGMCSPGPFPVLSLSMPFVFDQAVAFVFCALDRHTLLSPPAPAPIAGVVLSKSLSLQRPPVP